MVSSTCLEREVRDVALELGAVDSANRNLRKPLVVLRCASKGEPKNRRGEGSLRLSILEERSRLGVGKEGELPESVSSAPQRG